MDNTPSLSTSAGHGPTPQSGLRQRLVRAARVLFYVGGFLTIAVTLLYTEENWRGKRAWEAYAKELTAKGVVLDYRTLVPPPVPDAENFAMTPCLARLFNFEPGTETRRDPLAARNAMHTTVTTPDLPGLVGDWRRGIRIDWVSCQTALAKSNGLTNSPPPTDQARAAAGVLELLKPIEPQLAELREASGRPHSRFNIRYDEEILAGMLLPHLARMRGLAHQLSFRAAAELSLGDAAAALEDVMLALRLSEAVRDEPILISQLVRCAMLQATAQPVWEGVANRRWSDAQLQSLQQRLQRTDYLADLNLALRAEQAIGNNFIDYLRMHPGAIGKTDWNRRGSSPLSSVSASVIPSGWYYWEQVNYNRLFHETLTPALDLATRRVKPATTQEGHADTRSKRRILAGMLLPGLPNSVQKLAYAQTTVDELVLACALERHRLATGQFPETLAALAPRYLKQLPHDVISGTPLMYRRTQPDGFLVYSVGWNQKDDEGEVPPSPAKEKKDGMIEDGDWALRVP